MKRLLDTARIACSLSILWLAQLGCAQAQFIAEGGERPSTARKMIPVGPLRIIYPEGHDSIARAAARYAALYRSTSMLHRTSSRRFPVVMRSFTPISNGMVAWVPSRMELYSMTAGEQDYPVRWLNHLISHEMRHYAQLHALGDGPFRWLYFLLGEQSTALASFFTPLWYFEGDAIYHESRAAGYGRAQSALTYQQFRTDLLTGNRLSYDQYLNRSLRYNTPNHYQFGTLMVEYGVHRYGEDFWRQVVSKSRWHSFALFPFHFGIQSITGNTRHQLFNHAMLKLDSVYRSSILFPEEIAAEPRGEWHDERYPHFIIRSKEQVLWRRSFSKRRTCYAIGEDGTERKIVEPVNLYGKVRYCDTLAIWSEIHSHPIWRMSHTAPIRCVNLMNARTVASTKQGNYISPCILPHRKEIAAIRVNSYGHYDVVLLPIRQETEPTDSLTLGTPYELRELCFNPQDSNLIARAVDDEGMHLLRINLTDRSISPILSGQPIDATGLACDTLGLYFTASYQYARRGFFIPWNDSAKKAPRCQLLRITSHGVEDLTPLQGSLLSYAAYTVNGYRILRIPTPEKIPIDTLDACANPFSRIPTEQVGITPIDTVSDPIPYSKPLHAVRIHSWIPSYSIPALDWRYLTKSDIGITFMSQNDLGTLTLVGSLFHKETYGASLAALYTGIWPHISLEGRWGGVHRLGEQYRKRYPSLSRLARGSIGIQFPTAWYVANAPLRITPSVKVSADNERVGLVGQKESQTIRLEATAGLKIGWHTLTAPRNLFPKWGFTLGVNTSSPLARVRRLTPWYSVSSTVYLPGIASDHSVRLIGKLKGQWFKQDLIIHRIEFIGQINSSPLYYKSGLEMQSAVLEYSAPIAYPDINLRSWLYIKRLYTTMGIQYASIRRIDRQRIPIRTAHLELLTDLLPLRTHYECTLGIRGVISPFRDRLGEQANGFWSIEAIVGVNLPPRGN